MGTNDMSELKNAARERLLKGELSLGVGLRQARTVDTANMMAASGMDWLFIDLEHNSMPLDTAVQISVATFVPAITDAPNLPRATRGSLDSALVATSIANHKATVIALLTTVSDTVATSFSDTRVGCAAVATATFYFAKSR